MVWRNLIAAQPEPNTTIFSFWVFSFVRSTYVHSSTKSHSSATVFPAVVVEDNTVEEKVYGVARVDERVLLLVIVEGEKAVMRGRNTVVDSKQQQHQQPTMTTRLTNTTAAG